MKFHITTKHILITMKFEGSKAAGVIALPDQTITLLLTMVYFFIFGTSYALKLGEPTFTENSNT